MDSLPVNAALIVIDVQEGFDDPSNGPRSNLDAEANITRGYAERVVIAAGGLVEIPQELETGTAVAGLGCASASSTRAEAFLPHTASGRNLSLWCYPTMSRTSRSVRHLLCT